MKSVISLFVFCIWITPLLGADTKTTNGSIEAYKVEIAQLKRALTTQAIEIKALKQLLKDNHIAINKTKKKNKLANRRTQEIKAAVDQLLGPNRFAYTFSQKISKGRQFVEVAYMTKKGIKYSGDDTHIINALKSTKIKFDLVSIIALHKKEVIAKATYKKIGTTEAKQNYGKDTRLTTLDAGTIALIDRFRKQHGFEY